MKTIFCALIETFFIVYSITFYVENSSNSWRYIRELIRWLIGVNYDMVLELDIFWWVFPAKIICLSVSFVLTILLFHPPWICGKNLTKRSAIDPTNPDEMIDISNDQEEVTSTTSIKNVSTQTLMTLGLTQYSDKSTQAYFVKLSSDSSRYLNNPGIDHLPTQVTLMKWKHLDVETIQTFKTQASQTDDDVLCLPEIPIATEWRYNTRNVGCQTETRKIVN